MHQVRLQFSSIYKLRDFTSVTKVVYYEMNKTNFSLVCTISEKEIELAQTVYNAKVVAFKNL